MSYFKKANIFKEVFFSKGTVVILFFLIIFSSFGLYSIYEKSVDASNSRKLAEDQVVDLKSKESDLSKKINMLKTKEGQIEVLKEQYPVVASGEKVVVITDNDDGDMNNENNSSQLDQKKSFWTYLKNLFK